MMCSHVRSAKMRKMHAINFSLHTCLKMYECVCDLQAHLIAHLYLHTSLTFLFNKSIINIILHDMCVHKFSQA